MKIVFLVPLRKDPLNMRSRNSFFESTLYVLCAIHKRSEGSTRTQINSTSLIKWLSCHICIIKTPVLSSELNVQFINGSLKCFFLRSIKLRQPGKIPQTLSISFSKVNAIINTKRIDFHVLGLVRYLNVKQRERERERESTLRVCKHFSSKFCTCCQRVSKVGLSNCFLNSGRDANPKSEHA